MKTIKFISAIALTLAMASCENFDLPNPPGQTNPEPVVFENSGIQLEQGEATVNLVTYNEANEFVNVANVTELVNFPEDYTLSVDVELAKTADFAHAVTLATELEGDKVMMNPDVINGAIQEIITKKPGTYDVYARYAAYAERGTTRVRLGGLDAFFAPNSHYTVTTLNPAVVMEEAYYLVPCRAGGAPEMSKAIKMNNTLGDVSVYDNPVFALQINVDEAVATTDEGYLWKLAPESAVVAGNTDGLLGCNPSASSILEGRLGAEYAAGAIHIFGPVLVTVNVQSWGYTVGYALENLWPLSGSTVSRPTTAMMLYTNDYIHYTGVSMLNKSFIIAGQPDRNGTVVFKATDEEPVVSEDGYTQSGAMSATGTKNIDTPVVPGTTTKAAGLFWMNVNLVEETYEVSYLETLSLIGGFNGWSHETSVDLTPSKDYKTWTVSDVELDGEFKIAANKNWDISFSGTTISDTMGEHLYNVNKQDGGENLSVEKGKYDVELNFSAQPYVLTLKKK
ncbi:MAG: hypothetical protein K2N88_05515 [Muribaculaceae bacterium]|nr:hypothetical protein [Muribaculaceae bacterium]